jgi:hypothetical protein
MKALRRSSLLPAALAAATLAAGLASWAIAADNAPVKPQEDAVAAQVSAEAQVADAALVRRALALVSAPRPPRWRLRFSGPRAELRGEADVDARQITVFVRPGDAPHRVAHDIAHELGHAWDAHLLDDAARTAWLGARGVPAVTWWPDGTRRDDYATGAGDFAEVFARCHAASPEFRSRLAPAPADACALLPAVARGQAR